MTDNITEQVIIECRHAFMHLAKRAGMKPSQIARVFNVNKSTVTRALNKPSIRVRELVRYL